MNKSVSIQRLPRYLFKQSLALTLGITGVITAAMWLTQSLRFIDYVMNRGLSFVSFLELSAFLIPGLISPILPIAFLIGIIFVFNRLYADRELIVLKAIGLSNGQIIRPFLLLASLVCITVLALNLEFMPAAKRAFKDKREEIRNNLTGQWLQPGQFMTFNRITFYAREKNRAGAMRGILIYDCRKKQEPVTIIAEYGQVSETPEGLRFEIFNGSRQILEKKTRKPEVVNFDNYLVDVRNPQLQERTLRLNEMSLSELINFDNQDSLQDIESKNHEVHERIVIPLLVFPFVFIVGIGFLRGDFSRRGKANRLFATVGACILLEVVILGILNSSQFSYSITTAYAVLMLVITLAALHLVSSRQFFKKRSNRFLGESS